jgi:hypothetical protein
MKNAVSKIGVFGMAVLVLFLVRCGSAGSAIDYNDEIVKLQANVIERVLDLVESLKTRQPEAMRAKLHLSQQEATKLADTVADMPGFDGSPPPSSKNRRWQRLTLGRCCDISKS